jgi:hypothetical protein
MLNGLLLHCALTIADSCFLPFIQDQQSDQLTQPISAIDIHLISVIIVEYEYTIIVYYKSTMGVEYQPLSHFDTSVRQLISQHNVIDLILRQSDPTH